jgi:hypothetical protein
VSAGAEFEEADRRRALEERRFFRKKLVEDVRERIDLGRFDVGVEKGREHGRHPPGS